MQSGLCDQAPVIWALNSQWVKEITREGASLCMPEPKKGCRGNGEKGILKEERRAIAVTKGWLHTRRLEISKYVKDN